MFINPLLGFVAENQMKFEKEVLKTRNTKRVKGKDGRTALEDIQVEETCAKAKYNLICKEGKQEFHDLIEYLKQNLADNLMVVERFSYKDMVLGNKNILNYAVSDLDDDLEGNF